MTCPYCNSELVHKSIFPQYDQCTHRCGDCGGDWNEGSSEIKRIRTLKAGLCEAIEYLEKPPGMYALRMNLLANLRKLIGGEDE